MHNFLYNFYSLLTETYILCNVCLLLIYGVSLSMFSIWGYPLISKNLSLLVFQVLSFSLLLTLFHMPLNLLNGSNFLVSDLFSYYAKLIILIAAIAWFLLVFSYIFREKLNVFEFWILILLAILAMLFAVQVYDLLSIYLIIEFQSLIFYILVSMKRTSEFSTEAGLKYFILGAFSSALLLFGSSIIYGLTGLTNLGDISKFLSSTLFNDIWFSGNLVVGFIFLLVALLFKLSAAPFHMWSPDVYEGTSVPVTAFLSILPKVAVLGIIIRLLLFIFHDLIFLWQNVILISTFLSILIGTLGAMVQRKWKRFIAYSSINHVGFFLLALLTGDIWSISSIIFYVIIYIITMIGIFAFTVDTTLYNYPKFYQIRYLYELDDLVKLNPYLAFSLIIFLFSIAGVPPLAGFFAKLFVLLTALQINAFGISIFAIFMSCIACFYYIRIVKNICFSFCYDWKVVNPMTWTGSFIMGISLISIIFLFLDVELISVVSILMSIPLLY
uniref:NADH dehydrogenase subunit 2 n=1 Tax=Melanthalia intermedia TaxID=172989 RepID=A0A345UBP7_9FLOR|nr:NADH dehydrogenase subunit 2 [Melanthalia intermedia]AXI97883.1 NADH dehydrogenase subunit 2 [Melanthalia intermedia]